tara:strand:+ start:374 stop:487 length:114 start_codon:yes stop_codon:yes gene_type:complete
MPNRKAKERKMERKKKNLQIRQYKRNKRKIKKEKDNA